MSEARFGDQLVETFAYDAARNMAGASSSGPPAISGLGEDIGKFVAWTATPGGKVLKARGPNGEIVTLDHDIRGRVIARRVERNGFRPRRWIFTWDAKDRLIAVKTPENETGRYGYDPFGRQVWKVKEFSEAEARSYIQRFPGLIDAARLPDRGVTLQKAPEGCLLTLCFNVLFWQRGRVGEGLRYKCAQPLLNCSPSCRRRCRISGRCRYAPG
ncbi:hypothetical protein LMIY3S_02370 [Labrys miyagiensis]